MIIKILDNNHHHVCIYAEGRWYGNLNPTVIGDAMELLFSALKRTDRGRRFFYDVIRNWPIEQPGTAEGDYSEPDASK